MGPEPSTSILLKRVLAAIAVASKNHDISRGKNRDESAEWSYYQMRYRSKSQANSQLIPTDDEIIRRVQAGDGAAFVALFDRYYVQVHRFARWQTGDSEAASDFASETFERAYRAIKSFRTGDNTPYLAYLMQIARRL